MQHGGDSMDYNADNYKSENTLLSELKALTIKFENDIVHYSLVYDELVYYFHTYMLELVDYNPLNLYNNPLSKFIKEHLGDEIPGCFRDEFRYYEEDSEFKQYMSSLIQDYGEAIKNGYGISDSEFRELYELSLVDEENSDMYVRYLLSQLIENENATSDNIYKDLITRFVGRVIEANGVKTCFRIGKPEKKEDDVYADSICKHGVYYITFDEVHLSSKKVMDNLEDIFHEIWHTVQDNEEYNDPEVIKLIKMDDFIRRVFGYEYYHENYNVISYEVDANLHAVMMQASLFREISPATYELNKDWLNRRAERYSELLYCRRRTYGGEEYDIDVLFDRAIAKSGKSREDVLGSCQEGKKYLKEISFK